ncbi:MAG TPA: glycosyltransferase family 4 protein [Acidobacteriota bacterium]
MTSWPRSAGAPSPAEPRALRVFFLCGGTREFAPTRLRVLQYLPLLRARGIECEVSSISGKWATVWDQRDAVLDFAGRLRAYGDKLLRPLRRARLPRRIRGADVLFVQRALGPIAWQRRCAAAARRCVFDLDDGIHLAHPQLAVAPRRQRRRAARVSSWLALADTVIAASPYLARQWPEHSIAVLPTPVDCERVRPVAKAGRESVVVGWIGSPPNAAELELVREPWSRLARRHPQLRLLLVGAGQPAARERSIEYRAWSESVELEALAQIDIGIMPLTDRPWNRLKGGYKLLLYMAAGLPVVASPVGINRELVRDGENGFLAPDPAAWEAALERLILDPARRAGLGARGRAAVESDFSLVALAPRLARLLETP